MKAFIFHFLRQTSLRRGSAQGVLTPKPSRLLAFLGQVFWAVLVLLVGVGRTEAASCGMNFRWLNNAGFELVLSSGAHVLIDPWLDSAKFSPVPLSTIERADYLVLTHIHADHAQDVGAVQQKFRNVRIFTGMLSAEPLAKWHNLDVSRLYKVTDGQEFRFDDVTIKAFAGRHTESNRGNFLRWDQNGRLDTESVGLFDLYQYLVTDSDGTAFLIFAGTTSEDSAYRLAGLKVDIAAVHISPKQDFAVLARIINAINSDIVMPHHYDIWPFILRTMPNEVGQFPKEAQPVTAEDVIPRTMTYVEKKLKDGNVKSAYVQPAHNTWYHYDRQEKRVVPGLCPK